MNKNIYKKVWNTSRGCLVAVDETKTSKGKAKAAVVTMMAVLLPAFLLGSADTASGAVWSTVQYSAGQFGYQNNDFYPPQIMETFQKFYEGGNLQDVINGGVYDTLHILGSVSVINALAEASPQPLARNFYFGSDYVMGGNTVPSPFKIIQIDGDYWQSTTSTISYVALAMNVDGLNLPNITASIGGRLEINPSDSITSKNSQFFVAATANSSKNAASGSLTIGEGLYVKNRGLFATTQASGEGSVYGYATITGGLSLEAGGTFYGLLKGSTAYHDVRAYTTINGDAHIRGNFYESNHPLTSQDDVRLIINGNLNLYSGGGAAFTSDVLVGDDNGTSKFVISKKLSLQGGTFSWGEGTVYRNGKWVDDPTLTISGANAEVSHEASSLNLANPSRNSVGYISLVKGKFTGKAGSNNYLRLMGWTQSGGTADIQSGELSASSGHFSGGSLTNKGTVNLGGANNGYNISGGVIQNNAAASKLTITKGNISGGSITNTAGTLTLTMPTFNPATASIVLVSNAASQTATVTSPTFHAGTISNAGTMNFSGLTAANSIGGTLSSTGGTLNLTSVEADATTINVTGGTLNLNAVKTWAGKFTDTAATTNVNGAWTHTGDFTSNNTFNIKTGQSTVSGKLTNNAALTIDTGSTGLTVATLTNNSNKSITNKKTLTVTGSSLVNNAGATINNSGTITANSATIENNSVANNALLNSGTISTKNVVNKGEITNNGKLTVSGNLKLTGGGKLTSSNFLELGSLTMNQETSLPNGRTLYGQLDVTKGTIKATTLAMQASTKLSVSGNVIATLGSTSTSSTISGGTIDNKGTLTLTKATISGGSVTSSNTATLTNNTISGGSVSNTGTKMTITNPVFSGGTVTNSGTMDFTGLTAANSSGGTLNSTAGTLNLTTVAADGTNLNITGGILNLNGVSTWAGKFTDTAATTNVNGAWTHTGDFTSNNTFNIKTGQSTVSGKLTNNAALTIESGASGLTVTTLTNSSGKSITNNKLLTINGSGTSLINNSGATINNTATITATNATIENNSIGDTAFVNSAAGKITTKNFVNKGEVNNLGTLNITGDLKLTGGGKFTTSKSLDLGSLTMNQETALSNGRTYFGQLDVTGGTLSADSLSMQATTKLSVSRDATATLGSSSKTSTLSEGTIDNKGTLTLTKATVSGGSLQSSNKATLTNNTISGGSITNSGTMEIVKPVTASGSAGSISSSAGTLKFTDLNMVAGNNLSLSATGGEVDFNGTTNSRNFTTLAANLEVNGNWTHANDYTFDKTANINAGQTTIQGTLTNSGALTVKSTATGLTANIIKNVAGATFENNKLVQTTSVQGDNGLSLENSGIFNNNSGGTVQVFSFIINRSTGTFTNSGIINNTRGITNYGTFNNKNDISLSYALNAMGGSNFNNTSGTVTVEDVVKMYAEPTAANITVSGGALNAHSIDHQGIGKIELSGTSSKITTDNLLLQGAGGSLVIKGGEFKVNELWTKQNAESTSKINISGGKFSIPYANVGSALFISARNDNKIFSEVISGSEVVEDSQSDRWYTRIGAHLSDDIRLNQLEMSGTGNVTVRGASSFNARDVAEIQEAFGTRYGVNGTTALTLEGHTSEIPIDRDRLTVYVANAIADERHQSIFFYRESLDGRIQKDDNTYSYSPSEKGILVSSSISGDNELGSGFGFNSIQYANSLQVAEGSKVSVTGVSVDSSDTYLVSKNEGSLSSAVMVGGTLDIGIDTVEGKLGVGQGRFGELTIGDASGSLNAKVNVKNGQYKIDSFRNTSTTGTLSLKSEKATSLTLGAIVEDIGKTVLAGAGTLILDSDPATSYVLNDLEASGGTLSVTGGDYTVSTLNTFGKLNVVVDSSEQARKATLKLDNRNTSTGGNLNADFTVGDYSTLVFTASQDYNVNKIDLGENGNDRNLLNSGNLHTGELSATGADYTQNGNNQSTLIADAGWFTNSTLKLNAGYIDAANIKDSEGNLTQSLGQNTYIVRSEKTLANLTHKQPDTEPWDSGWSNEFTILKADTVTSESQITLQNGGLLKVNHLELTENTPTIHMQGGVLETSLDNFFSGYTYQPVLPLEDQDVSGVEYGMNGVKDPIISNLTGINGNEGWIVITDNDIFATAVTQIISEMHKLESSTIGSGVGIEFSGRLVGEFTVDDANRFVEDETIPEHSVVFRQVALANKVSTDKAGVNKHLWVGSKDGVVTPYDGNVPNRLNVGEGLGFTQVTNATRVTVDNGKEFALIGFENHVPFDEINHSMDAERFNRDTAFLPDATGNGVLRAQNGAQITLGNKNITEYHSIGWVDSVELENKGKLFAQNGEYAIWHIHNDGGEFKVAANAYIHSKGTTEDSNGLWTNAGSIVFGEPDVDFIKVNLAGTLENSGLVDANNTDKLTFDGTVNNRAGGVITFNNGSAKGTINNEAGAEFTQTNAADANYQLKSATFNNSGKASFISLDVGTDTDGTLSTFDNKEGGSFSVANSLVVGGKGKFTQDGEAVDSDASLVIDAGGLYENNTQKVSKYASVTLGERASEADPKATVNNYGEFEVKSGDFTNSGVFSNESHKGETGNVSTFKVTSGNFNLIGGEFQNHEGASMVVEAGSASLKAGVNLPDQISKITNHGTAQFNDIEASGGSVIENGLIGLLPEGDSLASFTAGDLDFDSSFVKNYANLDTGSANFHNAADVDEAGKKLFVNNGVATIDGGLTLENAWAENRRGSNVANGKLTADSLDLVGEFSKLENYDLAEVGSVVFTGNAELINGDKDYMKASLKAQSIVNQNYGAEGETVEPANLTLHNEGEVHVAGEINVLGGLDLENGIAARLPSSDVASFEAASLIFKKDGENESHLTNEGTMNFIGKDGKGVELEGITVTNARKEARATFKGPYLSLKDSSFDNYNLADFRNVDADSSVEPKGVTLEGSTFTNNATDGTSFAKLYGKSLSLTEGSQLINEGVADFRDGLNYENYADAAAVLIDNSFVQTGVKDDAAADWAEFYGSSLTIRNQAPNTVAFENQAKAEFTGDVSVESSSVITGTLNPAGDKKATFSGASLDLTGNNSQFVNGSEAIFGKTVEGEDGSFRFAAGDVSAAGSALITNGITFAIDEAGGLVGQQTLNPNALIKGNKLTLSNESDFINVGDAQFFGDVSAANNSSISNLILGDNAEAHPSISGLGLTLDQASSLANNGSAVFDGNVLIENNSHVESVSAGGVSSPASITGYDLTLNENSYLKNTGSAIFAANAASGATGAVSVAAGSYITNKTENSLSPASLSAGQLDLLGGSHLENTSANAEFAGNMSAADSYIENITDIALGTASISGNDLTLKTGSYLNNQGGSAVFAANAETGATGAVKISENSYIKNITEDGAHKANLTGGALTLEDNSYLENTSASADFAGNVSVTDSYIESVTDAALGQASLTGNDLTLKADSHLTNQGGSAIFAANAATGATGAVDVSANSYIKNITADAANKATLSAGKLDLTGTSYLENTSAQADFAGDISAQASYITNTTQEGLGKASLTGGALTLQDSSYLENTSASADFTGDISAQASYITNTTQDGLGKATLTGGALTLQDNSYLDNTSASADFAGNITAQTSYITNTTQSGLDKATLTGNDLTLTDSHLDNTSGSVTLTANAANASTGSISATNSYVTNKTVSGLDRATLNAADLSLLDGSYLANTDGSALFTGSITAKNGSYIESLTVDSEELAQLTGTSLELRDGHLTNTGSALIGVNETTTADDGSETTVFKGGAINASNADILNGAVKGSEGNIVKANHEGRVLQAGSVTLDTGSLGNYASVVIDDGKLDNAALHNDSESSIRFDTYLIVNDKDSYNGGSIEGKGLLQFGRENLSEGQSGASLVNESASIKVGEFVAGQDSVVTNTDTVITADRRTSVGGQFSLENSSLDTGRFTTAAKDDPNSENYLLDLQNSNVWSKSARIASDLAIDENSVFTVGARKPAARKARSLLAAAAPADSEEDSAVFTGKITNKGKIVSYVDVVQSGQVNDAEHLVGDTNLDDGISYTAEEGLYTANVTGKDITFNQVKNSHVTIAEGGEWIHNSEVNISAGKMDAAELGKDGLGNNIYRVAFNANPQPDRPQADNDNRISGENQKGETVFWYELPQSWKDSQIVLKADSIARENGIAYGADERKGAVVEVYEGGVFAVNSIVLDGSDTEYTEAFIKLKGGALETTLGQLFTGEHHQPTLGVDEENPKNPSSMVDYYKSLKTGVISSISTDSAEGDPTSYFVFTDDNVLASTAASVVTLLHDANYKANVAFTGKSFENFDVDMANRLQSAVSDDPDNPLDYRVIFTDTTLDNTTAEAGDSNRSLIIGRLDPATEGEEGSNVIRTKELGMGFKAINNADDVTIQEGNEFVLVGFNGKDTIEGYEFGKSHEPDGPLDGELFNERTKLLVEAKDSEGNSIGGSIVVKDGSTLSLGTQFNRTDESRTIGWAGAADLSNNSHLTVRGGEFALWDLSTDATSGIVVTDTGTLHTDWIKGAATVQNGNILYVEKSTDTTFEGLIDNKGLFDTRGETVLGEDGTRVMLDNTFTLNGNRDLTGENGEVTTAYNLWNEAGSKSVHDSLVLAEGAKVLNDGGFDGNNLTVNTGTSVANNGTSSWNATVIDGTFTNKGSLALGEETHAVGVDGLLDNYKDLTAAGTISVDGVLNNYAGAQAQSSSSLTVNGNGLINNNSAMVFDAVKLTGLAEGDDLGTRFLNNNAVGEDGSVVSAATLDAGSLEVLGTFDNDGRVTIKDKIIAAPEGADEEPTVVAGNFALNGGSINNRGVFDVSGVADNKIETGVVDNTGRLIASDMVQEDGTVFNSGAGTVRAESWTMNEGSFTNDASNYTKSEDGSLENVDVAIKGDFTQNGGTASNAGAMVAKNVSLLDKAVSFVNEGVRSLLGIQENITQESGAVANDGTIVAGEFNEDGTPALDENGKPKSGNWTISDKASGLTNTSTDSTVVLSGDITQSSGKVTNNGSISAGNWTVTANASTEEGAVPTEGIANQGAASNIALRGDLSQGAGSFLNEGTVTVGGNWSITDETTAVDNTVAADQKALEKPFQPTITVGGDITQTAAAKTRNEGAITAGNWTIGGNSAGLDNVIAEGLTAENGKPTVTLSGNLTGSSGFITNDGTITAGQFNEDGSPVLNEEGKPVFGNWAMSDKAAGLTNTLTDSSVVLSGDITQSSGKVTNNGSISAGNWTVTANTSTEEDAVPTEGIVNVGAASNIALRGDLSQGAGSFLNEGTVKVGGNWSVTDETSVVNNTVAADQKGLEKPLQPTITVGGDITQTAPAKTTNEGSITAGNWTIGGTSAGLDNVISEGLAGENGKPTVTLSGSLTQSSGNFRNEGEVSIAGDWTEAGSVRTIDNVKNTTAENAAYPTITVGGDILQQHGFVTNEGKISAGYDKSGNAVEGKGNWKIDGITRGFANKGAESEIKLAGDLTQLFGHGQNDGTITADDYTIGSLGEDAGEFAGAGAAGLTNLGTVELRGSITESSGNVVNEGKIQAGFDSNGNAIEGKGDWTISDMSGGFENKGEASQIILSGNLSQASGFASNEGKISAGFDKDGNALEGKGNWTINDKSTGFANKGAASSIKLAGDFTQSVGDGLNEGTFTAHNYTMDGIASGLNNQATINEDGTVNTPSVTLTGSITQSSGMVNNEGTITAGYGAEADKGDWSFSGTAEGLANIGADTTVTLAGNITQSSGFVSNDGHMAVGFDKEGTAITGKGNWDINAPSATGFSNNLETSEIKLAGSINQEVGEATNKGLITAHDWTVTGSADGISNLGENSRVELTGNLAQLHGDIVNEGTMIGVDEKGELGLDNTYTAAGDNTNTGVFIFKGDMTQRAGDITNSRVDGGLPSEEDKFGTFTVGSITKSGGTIDNSALFTANGDVSQSAGSITNRDGGVMNLNGNLTVSEGSVSNLGDKSVINTGKAVFESADAAVATPVTNEGTINLESAKFALGSSLDNTGTINFKDFVSFDSMSEFRNDGNILETVDPDRVERTKVSIGDGINFATSGEIKADVLEIGSGTSYSAEDNSVNTFKTADFGKDNTQLHVGSGASFTLNGENPREGDLPSDVFKLGATTVASNAGTITLNNVEAQNDGYLDNAGGTILINQGTNFANKGRTEPATEAASEKLGGITGGSVIIDAGAHLVNSGTLSVDNLRQSANSVGSIFTVNEEGKQVVSDETDKTRAHFHQYGDSLKVKDDWFENTNIYVEKGAKIEVQDQDGTIRSLGNNNLYVLRSGVDKPEIEWKVNEKGELQDLRLKDEPAYLDQNENKYVRFKVDNVTLDGNNVFKVESGGTLDVDGLDRVVEKLNPTIIMAGGGVQTSLNQVFKPYPLGVGDVRDQVKNTVNLADGDGFLVFDDLIYSVEDVVTARRHIDKLSDTSKDNISIAFLGTLTDKELLVSQAHDFTAMLEEEDRRSVFDLSRNTLGNDRFPAGYGEDNHTIRIGTIQGEDDNYTIQESILVKNVGEAQTVKPSYIVDSISIEDGRSFGLGGWLASENEGAAYSEEANRLFKEKDGSVHVVDGKFGLGGLEKSVKEFHQESTKGWLGEVALEDKGEMEVWDGEFLVKNIANKGLINVKDGSTLHIGKYSDDLGEAARDGLDNGSKGLVNYGTVSFDEAADTVTIDSALHNYGSVKFTDNVNTLEVTGLVNDQRGFITDQDAEGVNANLKNLVIKDGGIVSNLFAHRQDSLTVENGGSYRVGAHYVKSTAEDGTEIIEKIVSPSLAEWTQTSVDGSLEIGEGSSFIARSIEGSALETSFGGTGFIDNTGLVDLTNAAKATIGHIVNRDGAPDTENTVKSGGTVRFDELTITAVSLDKSDEELYPITVEDKISFNSEKGTVSGNVLNLADSHRFVNLGAVDIKNALNLQGSNRWDNFGAVTTAGWINLGSSHQFNNSGSVSAVTLNQGIFSDDAADKTGGTIQNDLDKTITLSHFNQGQGSKLNNNGTIRFVNEEKASDDGRAASSLVLRGLVQNSGTIDASVVEESHIIGAGNPYVEGNVKAENATYVNQAGAHGTFQDVVVSDGARVENYGTHEFNDLFVNSGSEYTNYAKDSGRYLTVNKDSKYTVESTGESLWTDVFVIEGELEVIKGGTLTVLRDEGPTLRALSNDAVPENAEVHGKLTNHGVSRFHNLTLKESSQSHNNGSIVGGHLLQEKSAGVHTTSEISNSTWEVVEINEGLDNAGTFTINEALVANAKIHNSGNFSVGEKVVEQVLTHEFDNEGAATFNDLILQKPEESVLLAEEPETDLDLGLEEGSEEPGTTPEVTPEAGDKLIAFTNHGAKNTVDTRKFTVGEGFDVVVTDGAINRHEDLVLLKGGYLSVLNGASLEVRNSATLEGGKFLIGSLASTRDAEGGEVYNTSVDLPLEGAINADVSIISGGELRIGSGALDEAVRAGAEMRQGSPRLILSQPIEIGSSGSLAVGNSAIAVTGGASFGSDSQLIVNFAQLSEAPAITGAGGALSVEKGAEVQVNVTGIHKGRYYITQDFENTNAVGDQWEGGWKDNLVLIPRDMVARWRIAFGNDGARTWIDANQTDKPDVAAPDVAEELLDKVPPGPGGKIVQDLLNGENGVDPETAKKTYNSLVNLGFAGAQMATAYSTLTNAADAVQNRGSMIAEGFNKDGWRAHKTRTGDAWIQVLGSRDRVKRYNASKIEGGYESKSTGFIGGIARNLESANATIGAAVSYQHGVAKSKEGVAHTENRFYTFGAEVYGNWSPNPLFNIVGDAGYYYNEGKVDQRLIPASGFRKAHARIHTNMYTVGARAESTLKVGQASVIPHVGVRWIHGKTSKYATKLDGQTAFNSTPKATDTWQFPLGISVRGDITTKSGWKIRPTVDVSVILQAGDRSQRVLFGSPEVSATNMIYGRFTGNQIYMGQLGVQIEKGAVTYGIRYGYARGGYGKSDHEIKVEAIWRF